MSDRCSTCTTGCSSGSCPTDQEDRLPPGMLSIYDLDKPLADGILVWIEVSDNDAVSIERSIPAALGTARTMTGGRTFGIIFGDVSRKDLYGAVFAYGVDTLYHIRSPDVNTFKADAYAEAVKEIAERINPLAILISSTPKGNELAHKTAALFGRDVIEDTEQRSLPAVKGDLPHIVISHSEKLPMPEMDLGRKGTAINIPLSAKVKELL